jgi:hypothetical protein
MVVVQVLPTECFSGFAGQLHQVYWFAPGEKNAAEAASFDSGADFTISWRECYKL